MSALIRAAGLAASLALVAAVGPAAAAAGDAVTNPDWIEKPSGDELASVYPAAAQLLLIPGHALIGCRVAVSGDVEACSVIEESPRGEGFGAAALLLTPRFKMRPQRINGLAVGGAPVRIPISFALPDRGLPTAPADSPAPPEPSALARTFAERIVVAFGHEDLAPAGIAGFAANLNQAARTQIGDPQQAQNRDAAVADLFQAMVTRRAAMHRARVEAFARSFSESELGGLADFLESPAGRAFVAKGPAAYQLMAVQTADVVREATAEARKVYCASRDCGPALAHAPAAK